MPSPDKPLRPGASSSRIEKRPTRTRKSRLPRDYFVDSRRTTARIEDEIHDALLEIAEREHRTLGHIVSAIARQAKGGLSSAIRVYVVTYYRQRTR
jgi:predicted DNA-binding ribbon-helix-helix protein